MERVLLLGNNTSIKSAREVLILFNNVQLKRRQLLYLTVYIFETGDDDDDDDDDNNNNNNNNNTYFQFIILALGLPAD